MAQQQTQHAPAIYGAIVEIMKDIDYIGKQKENQAQHFKFRGVDDVMNKMKPLLAKHGVFVVTEIIEHEREERVNAKGGNLIYSIMKINHHFTATDGSEVVTTTIGEGMDSGDKASNKAMAVAFKYACFQLFCIPTEAQDDPDCESPEAKPKTQPAPVRPQTQRTAQPKQQQAQQQQQGAQLNGLQNQIVGIIMQATTMEELQRIANSYATEYDVIRPYLNQRAAQIKPKQPQQ